MNKRYRDISVLVLSVVQDQIIGKISPELTFYLNRQTSPDGFE